MIGGGPAGATAGRLLAEWGHAVAILERPPARHSLAESLPPSVRKLLAHVGALERVEAAGFLPARGNTSWWGARDARSERFSGAPGYQVLRRELDRILLAAAEAAGASVARGVTVRRVGIDPGRASVLEYVAASGAPRRLRARLVLDCSGRTGVLARRFRVRDPGPATLALSAVWRNARGFPEVDPTHTLVEAYPDGWAWSVPLSREQRHVAVMVDPRPEQPAGLRPPARYLAELARTTHLRRLLDGAARDGEAWACDATPYSARAFGGPGFLLVGDAGSFLDPMSSFGVKKALASAWMAAVVANTCLRHSQRAAAALALFAAREREMAAVYARESSRYVLAAADRHPSRFWQTRAAAATALPAPPAGVASLAGGADAPAAELRAAHLALKRQRRLRLRVGDGVQVEPAPEIQDREVVLVEAVVAPGLPTGVRQVRGVLLPPLLRLAPTCRAVPDLFEAYNRQAAPAALPDFLAALAFLVANRALQTD